MFKTKLIILLSLLALAGLEHAKAQESLPDTVWTKIIANAHDIIFSPDGHYVFAQHGEFGKYFVYKIETSTGAVFDTIALNKPLLNYLSISPTGDTLIVSGNGLIMLWNVNTGDTIFTLKYGEEAQFTPDGKHIIATTGKIGLDEPQILVIDIATKEIIKSFVGRYYYASNPQISSDGKYFSFTDFRGTYNTVILIDMITYEEIKIFEIPDGTLAQNIFSYNNEILGSYYYQNGIYLWDLKKLELFKNIKFNGLLNLNFGILHIRFSRDSKNIIFAYRDSEDYDPDKIIVWNIEGDSLVYEYPYSGETAIDVSKDDYIAAYGNHSGYLTLLRPKWNGTDVKDIKEDELKYSINDKKLKIHFGDLIIEKPIISIYDISGKIIKSLSDEDVKINVQSIEVDVAFLITGVYLVVVDCNGSRSVLKILK
ncbi:MAG: T9SS type A sorting domain-containing protein [bacterium]